MNQTRTEVLPYCQTSEHTYCDGVMHDNEGPIRCACECHIEQPAQAPEIVRSLRRIGVRPATLADLTRFEQRMAAYAEESTR